MEIMLVCIYKWIDERKIMILDCFFVVYLILLFLSFEWVKRKKRNLNISIKVIGDCFKF